MTSQRGSDIATTRAGDRVNLIRSTEGVALARLPAELSIMIDRDFWLSELLRKTKDLGGTHFSGIGLIVTDSPDSLPTIPLTETALPIDRGAVLAKTLSEISQRASRYHDGFHILSKAGELKRVAQYFSPPVRADLNLDRSKSIGGRYVAALFGSVLPVVEMTGIASNEFGIAVFRNGAEVFYEPAK